MSTSLSPSPSNPSAHHRHPHRPKHTYHNHRRESFIATDIPEQIEIRARLRTFEGAYSRTALASLGYSVLVLKLFDRRFYRIGLLYVILSLLLLLVQFQRRRHARHDFADQFRTPGDPGVPSVPTDPSAPSVPPSPRTASPAPLLSPGDANAHSAAPRPGEQPRPDAAAQKSQKQERVWGREFKTAGWSVVLVTLIVGAVEIALFGLVCAL